MSLLALTRLAGARHPLPHVGEGQRHPRSVAECNPLWGRPLWAPGSRNGSTYGKGGRTIRAVPDRAGNTYLAHRFFVSDYRRCPQGAPPDPLSLMWGQVDESRNSCRGCGIRPVRGCTWRSPFSHLWERAGGEGLFRAGVSVPCRGVPCGRPPVGMDPRIGKGTE